MSDRSESGDRRKAARLSAAFVLCCLAAVAGVAAEDDHDGGWIYLVKTEPSEPAREAEFNAWYDDIDIPDVLAVPSFRRARRAVGQSIPQFPDVRLEEGDGSYAALYDIATDDIDSSIIDLYVAARKMTALNRSTDALRVVEANYYRRLEGARSERSAVGHEKYFLVQKIICCRTESEMADYQAWHSRELVPRLNASSGIVETGLYVLYRAMEEVAVGDDEIPHLLAIHHIESSSIVRALTEIDRAIGGFRASGRTDNRYEVRDAILYKQLSDVRSD